MSCPDLKAYLFEEAGPREQQEVEQHCAVCTSCAEEFSKLEGTRAALLSVRDEEMPRRLAFVSDPVFEPRWYERLWQSGKLVMASSALLSAAILVHAFRPGPYVPPMAVQTPPVEAVVEAAVRKAVAEADARHEKKTRELLSEQKREFENQHVQTMASVDANFELLSKKMNVLVLQTASRTTGDGQ